MPMHCVTLQGPGATAQAVLPATQAVPATPTDSASNAPAEKVNNNTMEKSKELYSGRYKGVDASSEAEVQSTSNGSIPTSESVDESWRGGYSTAASRRRVMTACHWGNGVKWNQAIGRVGHWVRIYPHSLPKDDELPVEDVRDSVAQVSKFVRAAREVSRECGKDTSGPRDAARDAVFEEALRKKLDFGPHFQIWLPPF